MLLLTQQLVSVSTVLLGGMALILLIPIAVFAIECFVAILPAAKLPPISSQNRPRLDILVPAHNEAIGITVTLNALSSQLVTGDRLIVIADNCDDETAMLAQAAGAIVVERHDRQRYGKGYALEHGLRFMSRHPPEVVILVDADCIVQEGTIDLIARLSHAINRPVQALYLLDRPQHPNPQHPNPQHLNLKSGVSALAFLVKNLVRPRGLDNLGLPCLLTGNGMAFPWAVINQVPLGGDNIVEDMQLGLDLSIAGYSPKLCLAGQVTGQLPQQRQAIKSQRTRWEHGHLKTMLTQIPRLCRAAFQQKRFDLLAIALDLSVPPLSLLVLAWAGITILTILLQGLGVFWQLEVMTVEGFLLLGGILSAWLWFGRDRLPIHTLIAVPFYLLWKIPIYLAFLIRPQSSWIRTERDPLESKSNS